MRQCLSLLTALALFMKACGSSASPTPVPGATLDPAQYEFAEFYVEDVQVDAGNTLPADVTLTVQGNLPDDCTEVYQVTQERSGLLITVQIVTVRPKEATCTQSLVPHVETVRLGVFETAGSYVAYVNGYGAAFTLGEPPTEAATDYRVPLTQTLQTPDGGLELLAPEGWATEVTQGSIKIAATQAALSATDVPPAARLVLTVATGPSRAQDFGLDGRTVAEVYSFFSLEPMARVGPPNPLADSRWPGLGGHDSDRTYGDRDLRVFVIDEQTTIVLISFAPYGEWASFQPVVEAIIASIQVH
jgi:hypothetical protein